MKQQMREWDQQSSLMVPASGRRVRWSASSKYGYEITFPRHFTQQETALCVALGEQAACCDR